MPINTINFDIYADVVLTIILDRIVTINFCRTPDSLVLQDLYIFKQIPGYMLVEDSSGKYTLVIPPNVNRDSVIREIKNCFENDHGLSVLVK